ncbi:uncharacterized protein LOC108673974 isoform X2 [Hyalella azteca]|uniref:Uncharacterized protein LOC108673974 isoform X2 n=1 Tax=Hyalella azteca TaxID=294128 RepID=A0A8B7NWT5_HYAAZ|nr:uncharacterized protein LOC108673974 isoform X2 [Hyalella azteca]
MNYLTKMYSVWLFASMCVAVYASPSNSRDRQASAHMSALSELAARLFITIAPDPCTTNSKTQGICYWSSDCTKLQGTADGSCALGLGVCCSFIRSCGATTKIDGTLFRNPNFPSTTTVASSCTLQITPASSNICQIRLDFTDFNLAQPNEEGECVTDSLKVTGGTSTVPVICGQNSGQHLYMDVTPTFGSVNIKIDTTSVGKKWNIVVTQIKCDSVNKAPTGCLQYYTSTTGTIKSFNYDTSLATAAPTATTQLIDQRYKACIKSQAGYCSVAYSKSSGIANDNTFSMTGDPTSIAPGTLPPGLAGSASCTTDYLIIPSGVITDWSPAIYSPTITSADRFCGTNFPRTVRTSVQPFALTVVHDEQETYPADAALNDGPNAGFSLNYRMQAC